MLDTDGQHVSNSGGSKKDSCDSHPYSKPKIDLEDRCIDDPRKLRVAVLGGGLAGILAGVLFPAKVPGIELVIYEKNNDVVGLLKSAIKCLR